MKNLEIASLFQRTADVLSLLDGDSFRILAYRKIARVLSELPHAVEKLSAKELQSLPGIGKSSAQRITEYLSTGKIAEFEDTLAQVPAGVLEMTHIPSLGPKTAALFWKEAGVTTIDELKAKIDDGSLLHLPGLGEKKLKKIRANLDHVATSAGRIRLGEALPLAQALVDYLRGIPGVQKVASCGSLRRGKETIGDIDIAVAADPEHAQAISEAVTKHTFTASVIQAGLSKTSILTGHGVQVDVRTVPPKSWGAALQYFTGSQHHNVKLRQLALKKGYTLNEFGLFSVPVEANTKAARLQELLKKLPLSLPSGDKPGDALHKQFKKEIVEILDLGFARFLPEVAWIALEDWTEEAIRALESVLIAEYSPPFNSRHACMSLEVAQEVLSQSRVRFDAKSLLSDLSWKRCDSPTARAAVLAAIPAGLKGLYFFRAVSSATDVPFIQYVGLAARGNKGSSDLRYRIDDHFRDASGADNFINKFVDRFRDPPTEIPAGANTPIASETEEHIYNTLGLAWIPPELREDTNEIETAQSLFSNPAPAAPIGNGPSAMGNPFDLVTIDRIRGDLHTHTTASDGSHSIEEMVAEAKRRGFEYLAITDHSKSQFQANGLKADRLLEHIERIHAVAKEAIKSGFLLLAGSEVDILADGSLDYEDDLLAKLDWVVASPHAALSQESEAATQRLVRVAANPYVCVIGHPTGRLIPSRRGIEPDMEKVIFAAARNGIALEINANTHRLDLRDTHGRLAVNAKVPICIDTDAHSFGDFDELPCGILTARRAWATAAHILNTRPLAGLQQWLKDRKAMAGW